MTLINDNMSHALDHLAVARHYYQIEFNTLKAALESSEQEGDAARRENGELRQLVEELEAELAAARLSQEKSLLLLTTGAGEK